MNDHAYSLTRERVYWGAGIDKGSKAERELDLYFGNLRAANGILNAAGFSLDEKKYENEAVQAMSVVAQDVARAHPREARMSWDFGDDKTNYLHKAYEDIFSGRADSIKGEYQYAALMGQPKGKLAEVMRSTYDPIAMLDRVDRLFAAPWAAGIATIVEMHQNAGGSEESAAALYSDLMSHIDIISFVGELGVGLAAAAVKSPRLAANANNLWKKVGNFISKHGAEDTVRKPQLESIVSKSAFKTWVDYKRGLQVVQPATMVRNLTNVTVFRTGVDGVSEGAAYGLTKLANGVRHALYGKAAKEVPHMSAREIGSNARAMVRYMGHKKYRQFVDEITRANPDAVDTMLTRYVGDLEKSGANAPGMQKMVDFMNTPNWVQEQFNRKVQFIASLDKQLIHKGFKNGVDDIMDESGAIIKNGLSEEMIAKAADDSLYWTFAREADGHYGNFVKWTNETNIGKALQATGMPYPRYFGNAWKHFAELSPHNMLKVTKLFSNGPVTEGDVKAVANGVAGAVLTASFYGLEQWGVLGDDWSKVTIGDNTFDAKALLGPYAPYAMLGTALSRWQKGKLDMDLSHLVQDGLDSFSFIPNTYDVGLDQAKQGIEALVAGGVIDEFNRYGKEILEGSYTFGNPVYDDAAKAITTFLSKTMSGYLTPVKVGSDLLAVFDEDEKIAREMSKTPNPINISPLVASVPILKSILPPKMSATRAGPVVHNMGWFKQLSGLTGVDYNFIEREFKALGFSREETTFTSTGVAYYDYLMEGRTGQYMEAISNALKENPLVLVQLDKDIPPYIKEYNDLKPREKAEFVRNLFIAARDFADLDVRTKLLSEDRKDVLQNLKLSKVAQRKIAAMREYGYDFNAMDVSKGTLTSPMWARDNLEFLNIMPEDEFTPAPKGK